MAPNHKKKKKPASNPARGFATTSTISKSRVAEETSAEEVTTDVSTPPNGLQTSVPEEQRILKDSNRPQALSELTPEQLELQLEESELQLLVEKYGERSQRDVKRHATRLQKERKLLRMQSERLSIFSWLPNPLVADINEHLKEPPLSIEKSSGPSHSILAQEDFAIKIWVLKRTLAEVGFSEAWALRAISHLVSDIQVGGGATLASSKDVLWGLDYCLDWLALVCAPEDLPDYESHVDSMNQRDLCSATQIDFSNERGKHIDERVAL